MKTYRILTLGASGCGKTVFLASMFKKLSIQGEDGFFFDTSNHKEQKILTSVYTNLIAGGIWPTGTKYSEISEWSFTCRVRNVADFEDYPACKFVYFDYAGGRFTDMDEDDADLQAIIKGADAILGFLDGQKILALMNGNNDPKLNIFLDKDLPAIIKWMSHCKVPIQFVISKWDLLEKNFSLKKINNRLLKISIFEELVRDRNKKGYPVRLIPVSSVGTDFVAPKSDGSMDKIPGAIPRPFQVEVPVSCVIPDRLKQDIIANAKKEENIANQDIGETGIVHRLLKGLLFASPAINLAVEAVVSMAMNDAENDTENEAEKLAKIIASKFDNLLFLGVRKVVEANEKKIEELQKAKDSSLKEVKDETTALKSAVKSFLCIEEKLTKDFPGSEMSVH